MPPDPALTPSLALDYLGELSTDIRGSVVIDGSGAVAAHTGFDDDEGEDLGQLVADLFARAAEAAGGGDGPPQVEVSLPEGVVYAARERGWTLAVVAGRYALSSLMFYDLRMVIRDLAGERAARP